MKIDLNKKYRFRNSDSGFKFLKLLTILEDENQPYPVIGLMQTDSNKITPCAWTANGQYDRSEQSVLDLIEVSEWDYLEVDDPVLARFSETDPWVRRYFAGIENGMPMVWTAGTTSWTSYFKVAAKFCVLAGKVPEEFHTRSL